MTKTSTTLPAPTGAVLEGRQLQLSYSGTPVVHGAALRLRRGEVTALVGPNGSGKSTLLRSLARLHRPDAGEVLLADGTNALALSPKDFARRVTLMAQSCPTPHGIRVRDVVGYGRHPYRSRFRGEDPEGAEAVAWAMEVTGITTMAGRGVDELSGGELQRVWLATSLAQRTGVLLLDEPTTYLDLRYQVELLDLVRDLAVDHGVAVGVVLHDLNQAAAVADQLVLLDRGHVLAAGTPYDVLTSERLTSTYGIDVDVIVDPATGLVTTQAVGRHARRPSTAPAPVH